MYKLTHTESIIRLTDSASIPADSTNTDYQQYLNWLLEGNVPEPSDISSKDNTAVYVAAIQSQLDTVAQSFGYDDIKSAVTYAEEPSILKFQIEGKSLRTWRSLCWAYCYEQLDKARSNERVVPTVEELLAELPEFVLLQDRYEVC